MKKNFKHILGAACFTVFALLCAPLLQAQTIDLTAHHDAVADPAPSGAVYEWHTAIPVDATNLMTAAQAMNAGPGVYYGVWHFTTDGCYSVPAPIRVAAGCPNTDLRNFVDSSSMPAGNTVAFYSAMPIGSATKLASPIVTISTTTTFYVAFLDAGAGCASAVSPIVLLAGACIPDYTPSNDIDAQSFATAGTKHDIVVNITELRNYPNNGPVVVRIRKLSAFDITYNPTATTANVGGGGGEPVKNSDWDFTENSNFITITLKAGKVFPGFGISPVGFTLTRKANIPAATSQNFTATIVTGSGGDSVDSNNTAVNTLTAN